MENNRVTFPHPPPPPALPGSKLQGLQYYFVENFDIFFWCILSITISYRQIFIPIIWRKPVSCRRFTLPAERKKTHALIVSPWLCEPFIDTDQIWSGRWDQNVPFPVWQNYFPQDRSTVSCLQARWPNSRSLWFGLCNWNVPSTGQMVFPKFQTRIFVEWKARKVPTEKLWSG